MTQIINEAIDVNALAQEIRRVDGNHSLGACALAEALIPFLSTLPIAVEGKAPEGWQLVPKVPTEEMKEKGRWGGISPLDEQRRANMAGIWKAMLAAAPLPPSSPGKDGVQEAVGGWRWSFDDGDTWHHGPSKPVGHPFGDPDIVEPLYTRPQPANTSQKVEPVDRFGMKFVVNEQVPSGEVHIRDEDGSLLGKIVNTPDAGWTCAARKQSLSEPADCDWPFCGCDSYADKVIAAIEESGRFDTQPASTALVEALTDAVSFIENLIEDGSETEAYDREFVARLVSALSSSSTSREGER